jgi:sulfur carrier protein
MAVITVNGEKSEVEECISILSFLIAHEVDPSRVVVEHNFEIVMRETWSLIQLQNGDNLEIVKFLGGG